MTRRARKGKGHLACGLGTFSAYIMRLQTIFIFSNPRPLPSTREASETKGHFQDRLHHSKGLSNCQFLWPSAYHFRSGAASELKREKWTEMAWDTPDCSIRSFSTVEAYGEVVEKSSGFENHVVRHGRGRFQRTFFGTPYFHLLIILRRSLLHHLNGIICAHSASNCQVLAMALRRKPEIDNSIDPGATGISFSSPGCLPQENSNSLLL
jgi:hypothetical protein